MQLCILCVVCVLCLCVYILCVLCVLCVCVCVCVCAVCAVCGGCTMCTFLHPVACTSVCAGCRNLQCSLSPTKLRLASCMYSPMPVLPFAHLALYLFHNLPLFQVFMEDAFLISPFCTVLSQSYTSYHFRMVFIHLVCTCYNISLSSGLRMPHRRSWIKLD